MLTPNSCLLPLWAFGDEIVDIAYITACNRVYVKECLQNQAPLLLLIVMQ